MREGCELREGRELREGLGETYGGRKREVEGKVVRV